MQLAKKFADFGNALHSGAKSYDIVGRRKLWYTISAIVLIVLAGITALRGVNLGIEFTGGSEFQISSPKSLDPAPARKEVKSVVATNEPKVTVVGGSSLRIQTEQLSAPETEALRSKLASAYGVSSKQVTSSFIGPSWGKDVTSKALRAVVVFLLLVGAVMALYFRNIKSSLAAVMALMHDLLLTAFTYGSVGFEVTPAAVIGFLTILGYSLYDTVVVFDKVRENTEGITEQGTFTYAEAVNRAVNQTLVRSINTSVVALLPVGAILFIGAFLLGAGTLKDISLALFVGILVGTYSSIFLAPCLLVGLRQREAAIAEHTARVIAGRKEKGSAAAATSPEEEKENPAAAESATRVQPRRKTKANRKKGQR
ncbi:protein translocase subunit SecF [Dermabacteraceae bacterium P13147]